MKLLNLVLVAISVFCSDRQRSRLSWRSRTQPPVPNKSHADPSSALALINSCCHPLFLTEAEPCRCLSSGLSPQHPSDHCLRISTCLPNCCAILRAVSYSASSQLGSWLVYCVQPLTMSVKCISRAEILPCTSVSIGKDRAGGSLVLLSWEEAWEIKHSMLFRGASFILFLQEDNAASRFSLSASNLTESPSIAAEPDRKISRRKIWLLNYKLALLSYYCFMSNKNEASLFY